MLISTYLVGHLGERERVDLASGSAQHSMSVASGFGNLASDTCLERLSIYSTYIPSKVTIFLAVRCPRPRVITVTIHAATFTIVWQASIWLPDT